MATISMNTTPPMRRLILWDPDNPEYPLDVLEVEDAIYFAMVIRGDDYERYLQDLLASPDLEKVQGILAAIALRHGLAADEAGKRIVLHSVLLTEEDRLVKLRAIAARLQACESAGDEEGQIRAMYDRARLDPVSFDSWQSLVSYLEKKRSAALALKYFQLAEPYLKDHGEYWQERLRLACASGNREVALAEGRRLREKFSFLELLMQADEDYLLAWRTDPDAEEYRKTY